MKRRNTQMKKITVLSTILLGCLFLITVQGDSSARVVPQAVTAGKELGHENKLGVSSQKEASVKRGAGYIMRKLGLGGKKLYSRQEVTNNGETSKISGEDNDGLKCSSGSRDQKNDDQIMRPKEYLKSRKFEIPTTTNPKSCSKDCNAVPSDKLSSSSHEQSQKDEAQIFGDAAKEIANMMNKDYRGSLTPRHRPPINNNEPRN